MRTLTASTAALMLLCACGRNEDAGASGPSPDPAGALVAAPSALPQASTSAPSAGLAGRTGELVNPDEQTMIFLYYDLAGLTPPVETWIAEDSDVRYGDPASKPARREELRAAYAAAQARVKGVGRLRLTVRSNLSDYDPTNGEFIVQALAPGSTYGFRAFSRRVTLRLGNGEIAQRWVVPAAQAQTIVDKVRYLSDAEVDMLVQITDVQPGSDGGSLTAQVLSYEVRDRSAGVLGRVEVARP